MHSEASTAGHTLPEQGVDERRLAGLDPSHHGQAQGPVEVTADGDDAVTHRRRECRLQQIGAHRAQASGRRARVVGPGHRDQPP